MLNDYEAMTVAVTFRVPDTKEKDAALIPIRLELDIRAVYDALYGRPMKTLWIEDKRVTEWNPKGYDAKWLAQAGQTRRPARRRRTSRKRSG